MTTLIAIPCMSSVPTEFFMSCINLRPCGETRMSVSIGSLIYDSRNSFAADAINSGINRVLFIDSDMKFDPDLLKRLSADMEEHNLDYVSGIYFKRSEPTSPVIYSNIAYEQTDNGIRAGAESYLNYPRDSLFTVAGTGMGAALIKTDLLKRVWEKYGPPFDPMSHLGEDLSFCWRVNQLGVPMYCDSSIKCGHVGTKIYSEACYLSQNVKPEDNPSATTASADPVNRIGGTPS